MLAGHTPRAESASNRADLGVGEDRTVASGRGARGTGNEEVGPAAAVGHVAVGTAAAPLSQAGAYREASATPPSSEPAPIARNTLFVLVLTTVLAPGPLVPQSRRRGKIRAARDASLYARAAEVRGRPDIVDPTRFRAC